MSSTTASARAGRLQWLGLAVLGLPTLLSALDMNVLFLALPHLARDLNTSGAEQLWISDIYGFLLAGFVITMGTLGDRIGRRKLLFIGGTLFALLSVVAAYSVSPGMLIGVRALLGIAGATLMPSTLALITNMFRDERQRGVAISIWATCQFGGAALGPVVGGLLLAHFWWGSVFLLAVPVMVVLLAVGPFVLPEYRSGDEAGRLDLTSVLLSLLAVLPVVYGIKALATDDASTTLAVVCIVAGIAFGVAFVRRQLRLPNPLLDLSLFKLSRVSIVLLTLIGAGIVMAGVGMQITQYLQTVLGYSPTAAAAWFAPMGLGVAVGTMLTPILTKRVPQRVAISGGLLLAAVGAGTLALVPRESGLIVTVVAISVLALGTGPLFALGTGYVVGSVPPARAGAAASLSETGNYFGGAVGLAVLGTAAAAVYRTRVLGLLPETGSGPLERARETVGGATAAAASTTPVESSRIIAAAHDAFTSGIHVIGIAGGLLFLVLALATTRISTPDEAGTGPEEESDKGTDDTDQTGSTTARAVEDEDVATVK